MNPKHKIIYRDRVWRIQRNETVILEVRQMMDWDADRSQIYLLLYQRGLIWHVLSHPRTTQLTDAPSHLSWNDHYFLLWEAVRTPSQEYKTLAVTNLMSLKLQRKGGKRNLTFNIFILLLIPNRIWKSWKSLSASKNILWKSCLQAGIQIGYQSLGHWPIFVEGCLAFNFPWLTIHLH